MSKPTQEQALEALDALDKALEAYIDESEYFISDTDFDRSARLSDSHAKLKVIGTKNVRKALTIQSGPAMPVDVEGFGRGVWLDHICAEAYSDDSDRWNLMYLTLAEAKACYGILHAQGHLRQPLPEIEGLQTALDNTEGYVFDEDGGSCEAKDIETVWNAARAYAERSKGGV